MAGTEVELAAGAPVETIETSERGKDVAGHDQVAVGGLEASLLGPTLPQHVHWSAHPLRYAERSPRTWITGKPVPQQVLEHKPPKGSDYRDLLPPLFDEVVEAYKPMVKDGEWTLGLLEMWIGRSKYVKRTVHIPCWDSFRWWPLKWRGGICGRTPTQCWWTGLRYVRWARGVYAAGLGREYQLPEWLLPVDQEITHRDRIAGLCMINFLAGIMFSMVFGMFLTCGGFGLINLAGCYSCHAREKMRRRFNLPPAFGCPPGIDDCLVHTFCSYCASHQELRELVVRGVDGPGMHILDVLPESFAHVPGIEEQVARRVKQCERWRASKPPRFHARGSQIYRAPAAEEMTRDGA